MNKGTIKIGVATATALLMNTVLMAGGEIILVEPVVKKVKADKPKRQTKGNMTVKYNVLPGSVESVGDMFSEGIFYGRLLFTGIGVMRIMKQEECVKIIKTWVLVEALSLNQVC